MKNLLLSAFFVLALIVNGFAVDKNKAAKKETEASYSAKNNFASKFQGAKNVLWSNIDGYYKASFLLDGEKKSAFFDQAGQYVATTQYLKPEALPAETVERLAKLFKDYSVMQVLRFDVEKSEDAPYSFSSNKEDFYYFVSLKKDNKQIVVKVTAENEISYFKNL